MRGCFLSWMRGLFLENWVRMPYFSAMKDLTGFAIVISSLIGFMKISVSKFEKSKLIVNSYLYFENAAQPLSKCRR